MKKLVFVLLFSISASLSFSQELQFESGRQKHDGKGQLFSAVSQKSATTLTFIENVMDFQLKQQVEVDVTPGFKFKGTVSSITSDAPGLTTITIQSSESKGIILSVSRLIQQDKTTIYRGIVMSSKHSDMLMLEKDPVTGNYNWDKKQVSNLLAD